MAGRGSGVDRAATREVDPPTSSGRTRSDAVAPTHSEAAEPTRTGPAPEDSTREDSEPDPLSVARTICLQLLTTRARSRAELAQALRRRNVPEDAAAQTLDRLAEVGLINDHSFAAEFVRAKRAERGLSARELSRQLRTKGVDEEAVDAALVDISEDAEQATARQLAERKLRTMSGLDTKVKIRRLAGLLARKGYSPGLTFQVVRQVVGESAHEHFDSDTMLG